MRTAAAALAILGAVAGCATTAATPPDVGNFTGQPSQPILDRLGPPDSQQASPVSTVYRWRAEVVQQSAPVRTTTTDYSSGRPQAVEETRFGPQVQFCTLVLVVDARGLVTDFTRDGSRQACAPLLDKLTSP